MAFQRARSSEPKKSAHQEKAYKKATGSREIVFQTEAEVLGKDFQDSLICMYGMPKIGKSTLATYLDGSYFLPTEPGLTWLKTRHTYIDSWDTFKGFIEWAEKHKRNTSDVTMWVVDTVTILAKHCMYSVCADKGITHPSDEEYGKGWEAFYDEFSGWMLRLVGLGKGIMFICHEKMTEVTTRGTKIHHFGPDLPTTAYRTIMPMCDIILHMAYVEDGSDESELGRKRCLYTQPSEYRDAGDRSHRLPAEIPFIREKAAVRKILAAYAGGESTED
jgi:hypothetical protein